MKENRHQIMRRAGVRSWESRRQRSAKQNAIPTETKQTKKPVSNQTNPKKNRGSKVGIRIINK